jgi:uncharacterized protein with PIN domain
MIVDSSALLTIAKREAGWETFVAGIEQADTLSMSAASYS